MQTKIHSNRAEYVQLEIPHYKLEELFNAGQLCVSELHCLNSASKETIKSICKNSCAKRMHCFIQSQQSLYLEQPSKRLRQVVINSSKF